jgi:uncharacterized protein (TIGR00369 family)
MSVDPEFIRQAAEAMAGSAPQAQALGFRFVSVEPGRGSIHVPWREDLVGDPDTGVIAGGVVTTLLDHTCGMAIISAARGFMSTATLDLRIDYMRAAAPRARVTPKAPSYNKTRSIAYLPAEAWDADPSDLIATAQGAIILNRPAE